MLQDLTEENLDTLSKFGLQFQTKVLASLVSDRPFLEQTYDVIVPHYFESEANKWISDKIVWYFQEYKTIPTAEVFKQELEKIDSNDTLKISVMENLKAVFKNKNSDDLDYIKNEFLQFCKNQAIKNAVLKSADLVQRGKYDDIKSMIDRALRVGQQRDIGHMWKDDILTRVQKMSRNTVPTPWPVINKIMDGGLGSGELGCIVSSAGGGKCVGPDTEIEILYTDTNIKEKLKISKLFDMLNIKDGDLNVHSVPCNIKVKTPYGFYNIVSAFRTEISDTMTTTFSNGKEVTTSTHHLFKANGNWKKAIDIVPNIDVIEADTNDDVYVTKQEHHLVKQSLYDISVEKVHCYYSNDILSHNSWLLRALAVEALRQGKTVVDYTFELSEQYVGLRYDTIISGIEPSKIKDNVSYVKEQIEKLPGQLIIKYYPTRTATVNHLTAHLNKLKQLGYNPDLIIIDYADLMRSVESSNAKHEELGYIYEELRGMLGELQIPGWTASQSQRGASADSVIEGDRIAGAYSKVMTCDFVMSLSRQLADKVSNTGRSHVIKNRFGMDGMTYPTLADFASGTIQIFDESSPDGIKLKTQMENGGGSVKALLQKQLAEFNKKSDILYNDSDDIL